MVYFKAKPLIRVSDAPILSTADPLLPENVARWCRISRDLLNYRVHAGPCERAGWQIEAIVAMAKKKEDGWRPSPYSLFGLGFEIAVPVVLFMFVGYKADGWLETEPWLFVVGALLGVTIGFYSFFKRVLRHSRGPGGKKD
jgi:F0F1-type ATP synthase assembly protein I